MWARRCSPSERLILRLKSCWQAFAEGSNFARDARLASALDAYKFTGGIPSEWGALTNLKKLRWSHAASTVSAQYPSERLRILLT